MLSQEEIQNALHASRVVPINGASPHGPLGLEELAAAVERIQGVKAPAQNQVQRPIALPVDTWARLDTLAQELGKKNAQRISASEVVTALVIQGLDAAKTP